MPKDNRKRPIWSQEFRDAMSEFSRGFWESPAGERLRTHIVTAWESHKRTPRYDELRERLSQAAKRSLHRD